MGWQLNVLRDWRDARCTFGSFVDFVAQVAYFNSLKIDAPDAKTLFDLLDYDQSGEIDLEDSSGVQDAVGMECSFI